MQCRFYFRFEKGLQMTKRHQIIEYFWLGILITNFILTTTSVPDYVKWISLIATLYIAYWFLSHLLIFTKKRWAACWVAGTFLLTIPVGAFGYTSWLVSQVTLPLKLLRFIYLNRIVVVGIAMLVYVICILVWWQLRKLMLPDKKKIDIKNYGKMTIEIFIILVGMAVVNVLQEHLTSGWTAWLLLSIGTLLCATLTGSLIVVYFGYTSAAVSNLPLLIVAGLCLLVSGTWTLNIRETTKPETTVLISHRGVDGTNGVQNTVNSLKKTAKIRPGAVEMDIQQTKDAKFVSMHDPSLRQLANRNQTIDQLSLSKLRKIKLTEHGKTAKLSTFSEYLNVAHQNKIPLIIELKPQNLNPSSVASNFYQQYGLRIWKNRYRIHSVDSDIIMRLAQLNSKLRVGLIRPFAISALNKEVDFYSLDYRTINPYLIRQAHQRHQKVFAWTVNNPASARRMEQLGVDGIISDNVTKLREHKIGSYDYRVEEVKNILWQLI